jgi:hypothetical protein
MGEEQARKARAAELIVTASLLMGCGANSSRGPKNSEDVGGEFQARSAAMESSVVMNQGANPATTKLVTIDLDASLSEGAKSDGRFLFPHKRSRDLHELTFPAKELGAAVGRWVKQASTSTEKTLLLPLVPEHFELAHFTVDSRKCWLLRESERLRFGVGSFVIAQGEEISDHALLIEAPHEPFDQYTGVLAYALFRAALPRLDRVALFVNQAHRYEMPAHHQPPDESTPYDVCHSKSHPFVDLSEAYLRAYPSATVVQIHGFSEGASAAKVPAHERPPSDAAAVVSSGAPTSDTSFRERNAWREALEHGATGKIAVFPEETPALGATTNVLARRLDGSPYGFIHIELAAKVRQDLGRNADKRNAWATRVVAQLCRNGGLHCRH